MKQAKLLFLLIAALAFASWRQTSRQEANARTAILLYNPMRHLRIVCLSLLMVVKAGGLLAQNQSDSTSVKRDSITWSQELEGVEIKATVPMLPVSNEIVPIRKI